MATPADLPQFHVVGFTGHRRLNDVPGVSMAIREQIAKLRSEVPGEWIGLSSAAAGSDMLFAREAVAQGCSWDVILPLPQEEFKKDFGEEEWREIEAAIGKAGNVRVLNDTGVREDAYLDAGMDTVLEADILLAVWDGDPARGKGGTADVIEFARDLGRPIIIIDAKSLEVRRENESAFAATDHGLEFFNDLVDKEEHRGQQAELGIGHRDRLLDRAVHGDDHHPVEVVEAADDPQQAHDDPGAGRQAGLGGRVGHGRVNPAATYGGESRLASLSRSSARRLSCPTALRSRAGSACTHPTSAAYVLRRDMKRPSTCAT